MQCCLPLLQEKKRMLEQMSYGLSSVHRLISSMLHLSQEKDKLLKYVIEEVESVK